MRANIFWGVALLSLLLSGCTRMEQRSDQPTKKPLAAIEKPITISQKWNLEVGRGTKRKDVRLQLADNANTLYVVDAVGNLNAVELETAKQKWHLALRAPVSAGPTVSGDRLVVGTSDGKVITVDLAKQKIAWVSTTSSEILAAPTIADEIVYVHTMDGGLSALSLADGRQLWRYTHNLPPLMLRKSSSPVVHKENVIAGFANGKLLAMQKNDGSVVWSQEISSPRGSTDIQRMVDISADPIISGDKVYAASYQGNIASITLNNGNTLWERAIPSYSGFAASDNLLFVSSSNGDVVALDTQNGATYWMQTELQGRRITKPVEYGKVLVLADEDGNVHILDKNSGKIVGREQLDRSGIEATPLVKNDTLYILGRGGKLIALEVS